VKVTTERLPESRMLLNIEMEEPEVEVYRQRAYRKIVARAVVPGFRKGKAPRRILEQYLGPQALITEVIDDLISDATSKAIKEQDLQTVGQPTIDLEKLDPVTFKATVPLKPTVTLGDYMSLRIPYEKTVVTDDQVQNVMDRLQKDNTPWEPKEGPVEMGDMLTLTVRGYGKGLPQSDTALQVEGTQEGERAFLNETGWTYYPREESTFPVPGFSQQLIGLTKGETKEFVITAPADHSVELLAGKDCRFVVTVEETKSQSFPVMDDEWAKGVGDGYESLEALRASIRADQEKQNEQQDESGYQDKVLDELKAKATMEYPPDLVEHEVEHLLNDRRQRLASMGLAFEQYLAMMSKTEDDLKADLTEEATARVTNTLVLHQVAENEKIEVTQEDLDAEKQRLLGEEPSEVQKQQVEQFFASPDAQSSLRQSILARKAMDRLVAISKGEAADAASATAS